MFDVELKYPRATFEDAVKNEIVKYLKDCDDVGWMPGVVNYYKTLSKSEFENVISKISESIADHLYDTVYTDIETELRRNKM